MARRAAIDALLRQAPQLWRGREPNRSQPAVPTGHALLDAQLPGGGWPLGAVTEILNSVPGRGELSLLFPALAEIARQGHWLVLIDPPWIPYPGSWSGHGLALERLLLVRSGSARESLWACEQALHGSQGGAVLAWPAELGFARLRRLQLAAEAGLKAAFLFRPEQALHTASPAALRLRLSHDPRADAAAATRIDILKCRGERPREPAWLPRHAAGEAWSKWPASAAAQTRLPLPARTHGSRSPLPLPATLN